MRVLQVLGLIFGCTEATRLKDQRINCGCLWSKISSSVQYMPDCSRIYLIVRTSWTLLLGGNLSRAVALPSILGLHVNSSISKWSLAVKVSTSLVLEYIGRRKRISCCTAISEWRLLGDGS